MRNYNTSLLLCKKYVSKILTQKKLTGTYSVFFEAHLVLDTSVMVMRSLLGWESICVTAYLNTSPQINIVLDSQVVHWLFTLTKIACGAEHEQTFW